MEEHIAWLRSNKNKYNALNNLPISEDIIRYIWLKLGYPPLVQRQNACRRQYSVNIISSMVKCGIIVSIITMIVYFLYIVK